MTQDGSAGMHGAQVQEWRYRHFPIPPHNAPMDGGAQKSVRDWIQGVLDRQGWSAGRFAKKAGVAPSTVTRALDPAYEFVPSTRTLAKLAAVADEPPPILPPTPRQSQIVPAFLPVRYRAQAGHWVEIEFEEPLAQFSHAVAPDPRYVAWAQWLELVVGDSINLKIPAGQYAHVVDAIDMGYAANDGDWVVVERRRGSLRERTIKQIGIDRGAVQLWPRSTNPKWSDPVSITDGCRDGETIEVEIVGLVIGSYNPF